MEQESNSWWRKPCGPRDVLVIALPLVASTISYTVMHVTDRALLSWSSTTAVAAALSAGMLNWTIFSLFMGTAGYVNTFVAQYHGANQPQRLGVAMWQSLRIGLYSTPLFLALAHFAPQMFAAFGHEPDMLWNETLYIRVLAFGSGAPVFSAALSSFWVGRGDARVVLAVNVVAATLNIVLDVIFIFGYLGFPAGGIEGAAWATVTSQWFKVVAYFVLMYRGENIAKYGLSTGRVYDKELTGRLLYFGLPNGLQYVIEGGAITMFTLFVGRLGDVASAATAVAFSVNMMAFVPMIGMAIAVSTLVGQQLGAGRPDLAERATYTGVALALIYTGLFAPLYLLMPDPFTWMFGGDAGNAGEVRDVAVVLLRFVAAYCLFDALQMVFVHAIKGAGDTRFVLITTTVMSGLFIAAGVAGAVWLKFSLYSWWWLLTGWISLLGVIYFLRFLQGKWRHMSVIEQEYIAEETAVEEPTMTLEPAVAGE